MGAPALGEVDQYLSDQMITQRGETMGDGPCRRGRLDCFPNWRGAVGLPHGLFGPMGRGVQGVHDRTVTAHACPRLFELRHLPVVAERMWLRRRPFLEGQSAKSRSALVERAGFCERGRGRW